MNPRPFLLTALLLFTSAQAQASTLRDSFDSYAPESEGEPAWSSGSINFNVRGEGAGRHIETLASSGRGWLDWSAAPFVDRGVFSAQVTPLKAGGTTGWSVVGLGFKRDEAHFWHLALVQPPQDKPGVAPQRFVELSEMWDSTWNAQSEARTRVQVLEESPPLAWDYNKTYRLEIAFEERNGAPVIRGEAFEKQAQGEASRWKTVRALQSEDGQAHVVSSGRASLTSSGLQAAFNDAALSNVHAIAEPNAAQLKPVFPHFGALSLPDAPRDLPRRRASGFFGVGQVNGKWWLFDPRGQATLSVGTDHVNYNAHFSQSLGYAPYHRAVAAKFGSEKAWAEDASTRLKKWNFNVLGTGSSPSVRYQNQAHFEFLGLGGELSDAAALVEKTTWTGFPDVFDPRWARFCDRRARALCAPHRDDPWVVGYFLDNELEWWGKGWSDTPLGMAIQAAKQGPDSHGKRALLQVLEHAYANDLSAFNKDFGRSLKSWGEFMAQTELGEPATQQAKAALNLWMDQVARRYFEVSTAAVRRYDANHLIWGCRFAGDAPDAAWKWAGRTCDVVTVNIYPRVDLASLRSPELDKTLARAWDLTGRPIAVTEWSFPALDARDSTGKLLPSKHGAGMRVDNQEQKAQAWAVMQGTLLKAPFVVGSNYFMWADEPAGGISEAFPEDSNYGLVSESDEPYPELTRVATAINGRALRIHNSGRYSAPRLWKPSPPQALASNAKASVSVQVLDGARTISNGALTLKLLGPLQVLAADGTMLGSYRPLLNQVVDGQNLWTPADKIVAVREKLKSPGKLELDVDFATASAAAITEVDKANGAQAAQKASAQPFLATVRITIEAGQPYFEARAVSVKSLSGRNWTWKAFYHYTPSNIGGEAKDDELAVPDVPNYWMRAGAWRDASGWDFGVLSPREDERLSINFWKDEGGSQHPDARINAGTSAGLEMKPAQVWQAPSDEPSVAIFGLKESPAQPRPWSALALALRGSK